MDKSNLTPITEINQIVTLSKHRKAVLLIIGTTEKWLPAIAICQMTIHTVMKFIDSKRILTKDINLLV